jgi:serine/threonine-protein kinase RIO1
MDMALLLRKSGGRFALLAKDYELLYQGSIYGDLSFYNWKYAEFFIDQNQYVIRSDEKAKWLLEQNGGSIAC